MDRQTKGGAVMRRPLCFCAAGKIHLLFGTFPDMARNMVRSLEERRIAVVEAIAQAESV